MVLGGAAPPASLLKSPREIDIMARGGAILHATLQAMAAAVAPGVSTAELDAVGEAFIRSHAGAEPAFKGLYGFPAAACISVNEEIVHGIPSRKKVLREGDIVSIDVGVKFEGMFTDSAITVPVGTIDAGTQRLLDVTRRALDVGIAAAIPENHVGDIGAAIQAVVEAEGFAVVRELVGHAVGYAPHEELQVPNHGKPKRGKRLAVGLTIAIEPMVNVGTARTKTLMDKWTVVTADGLRSAHFEHTIAVTPDGPRILTLPG
ncbi:MAG: type I methionyl aminopeptidase [Gemmatimonadetes bacterium]|nr:type I methionyl aminopeptidase [Gemmatimonadota bacterium]